MDKESIKKDAVKNASKEMKKINKARKQVKKEVKKKVKKKRGFTLIELLAVILILGIIALIAIPTVSGVVENAKKSSLQTTTVSTIKSAEDACVLEKLQGEIVTNKHYINDYKSDTLDLRNLPKEGTITVDDNCSAYAAVTDGTYFATGTTDSIEVTKDETEYQEIASLTYTKPSCFKFDKETRTITGYNYNQDGCGTDIGIPSEIDNVPVEHIADDAFYYFEGKDYKMYYGYTDDFSIVEDYNMDVINKFSDSSRVAYYYYTDLKDAFKRCWYEDSSGNQIDEEVSLDYVPEDDKYSTCIIYDLTIYNTSGYITSVDFRAAVNLQTIGDNAFFNNEITSVKFGPSNKKITSIGNSAFARNNISGELDLSYISLEKLEKNVFSSNLISSVKFPKDLKTIELDSFERNDALADLVIPEGVEYIGYYAFAFCNNLNTVVFPTSLKVINTYAFYSDDNLSKIDLKDGVKVGGYVFCMTNISEFNVPNNSTIYSFAMAGSPVSKIAIGNNVSLSNYALSNSTATVDTLKIPGTLKSIPNYTFYRTKINNLIFENGTTTIGIAAFRESVVKNITWNNTLTSIGGAAFQSCNLKEIKIPSSVKTINYNAFYANKASNVTLEIPSSVTTIASNVFYNNYFTNVKINTPATKISIASNSFKCGNASKCAYTIDVDAAEGTIANAPWGNTYATINYLK